MDQLDTRLAALETKMDEVKRSVDRMYRFFMWTLIITGVTVLLPLVGLIFVVPKLISTYSALLGGF